MSLIGVFGGTFDPIHWGHVHAATTLFETGLFQEIRFIPCKQPVLKQQAKANAANRVAMLKLALQGQPHFIVDERELLRSTPSFMVETLESLAPEFPGKALVLILGMDAFISLPQWHQWQKILEICHIVVINRPRCSLVVTPTVDQLLKDHRATSTDALLQSQAGLIVFEQFPEYDISSTNIREQIVNGKVDSTALPTAVWEYIRNNGLYQATSTR